MDKEQVLRLLETHRDRVDEFAVKALFWLGSVALSHIRLKITSRKDIKRQDASFDSKLTRSKDVNL